MGRGRQSVRLKKAGTDIARNTPIQSCSCVSSKRITWGVETHTEDQLSLLQDRDMGPLVLQHACQP
jgi:hypothetical protein